MRSLTFVAAAAAILGFGPNANAQVLNPARFDDAPNVVSTGFGMDGPMIAEASYARIVDGRLALPLRVLLPLQPTGADFGLGGGAQLAAIGAHGFGVSGRLDLMFRRESTIVARFSKLGASATLLGGYFRERGSLAIELGFESGLLTHIKPSDNYRAEVYPDAHATWRVGGNGFFRAGVQGVLRIVGNTELTLRTGMTKTTKAAPVDLLPFYAMIGISHGF